MSSVGFLKNYILENPTVSIEEVLDDEEFLDELKIKNDSFLNYLTKHFSKLIEFLTIEPSVDVDYKRCYKFPYLSCEIFSTISPIFQQLLFDEDNKILQQFFCYILHKGELNQTLTGYIERLIIKYIKYYTSDMKNFIVKNFHMFKLILNQYKNDSICDIFFKILIIPSMPENESFEMIRKEGFSFIGNSFFNILDQVSDQDFQFDETCNALINVISILIRIINHINIFGNLCDYFFNDVFNEILFSKIEAIYYVKSDSKMTDFKISLSNNYIRIIENLNYLLFVILEKGLTRETKIENDGFDYTEMFDYEVNPKNEKKDDMNENINENNNYYITSKEENNPSSLYDLITEPIKHKFINIYITSFSLITEINLKIKKFISETKKIPQSNGYSIIPVSKCYIIYIDILLGLLMTENRIIYDFLKVNYSIFSILISDLLDYGYNSFLHNKILKLFEIVFMNNSLSDLKIYLIKNNYFDQLLSIEFDLIIDKQKKCILNNLKNLANQAQIMKILNFFYICINENEELKELYSKNQKFVEFELNLLVYYQISTKDLHSKEVQSISDLKNSGDEKITFEKNFYDSEAFLSTTKKTLENSKKLNIKLKQLDDVLANN